jgi:hypothetical protein
MLERLEWTNTSGKTTVGDASQTTETTWTGKIGKMLAIQLWWTGTPTGVLTVQLSNDAKGIRVAQTLTISDFTPAMTNPAGGASNTCGEIETAFKYSKIVYTYTSGTGTIAGFISDEEG